MIKQTPDDVAGILIKSIKNGGTIFVAGNGGSAEMSNHFVAELVGKFLFPRKALPAISLTSNTAIITAIANDYSFEIVFSRQLEALGKPGDVFIAMSTSGKSRNVLKALETAKTKGIRTIDFPRNGKSTPEIQEYQFKFMHDVCKLVERAFIRR
jgi:D-sedoheptulose 7-phosphate isomerase